MSAGFLLLTLSLVIHSPSIYAISTIIIIYTNTPKIKHTSTMTPEIIRNLPFKEYQARDGINNSSLKDIDPEQRNEGSPYKYHHNHVRKLKDQTFSDSDALRFGRAFHSYILTRDEFDQEYAIENEALYAAVLAEAQKEQVAQKRKPSEKFSKNLTAWKRYKQTSLEAGVELLAGDHFETIKAMAQRITDPGAAVDERTAKIFTGRAEGDELDNEVSLFAPLDDGRGNLLDCKARLDAYDPTANMIYALKSLGEWNPGRSICQWGWHGQAAFYVDMAKASGLADDRPGWGWIFSHKAPPHEALLEIIPPVYLHLGRIKYRKCLQKIHDCLESGDWPGPDEVTYSYSMQSQADAIC